MRRTLHRLALAVSGVIAVNATAFSTVTTAEQVLTVKVTRADLRPLQGVTLQLAGAVNLNGVTDIEGTAVFPNLPAAGAIVIVPSRSGFRFDPPQLTIPELIGSATVSFTARPTATDLALSIVTDDTTPLVGGVVTGAITLRNLGQEAATDVVVGLGSLPGLVLEHREATQGRLESRYFDTMWTLPQLDPGASAEVHFRSRATLAEASVLGVALIEEMDQADTDPLNNSAQIVTVPRIAQARLSLALSMEPATARAGETIPVRLRVRNDGPNDATQVTVFSYFPAGVSVASSSNGFSSRVIIPRLAPGEETEMSGTLKVRWPGAFTLIANVTHCEQQLPQDAPWPEARVEFTVQPAHSRITLFGFTNPPEPRVGDDVTVQYVAKNEGPDTVTGLRLFIKEDPRLGIFRFAAPDNTPPPLPGPFVAGDVVPPGAYTYVVHRYSVRAPGNLTNYLSVEYHDQWIADATDHPELLIPIKALPADVGLSLDANPKEITVRQGDPVTLEFPVHNDGPQSARGIYVDFSPPGLDSTDLDEVIHADQVLRPPVAGYIDVVKPGETVLLRKHFVAVRPGVYTNLAQITTSHERPDLLLPIASEEIRLRVLPGPPPDLAISVRVDPPQVAVGESAIFIVTVENRAAEPALAVIVRETDAVDVGGAFETVRSYGPQGDDRASPASRRMVPRVEPGASYSMSRTMRVRQPVAIPYTAWIESVNYLLESDLPLWRATTELTGVQVSSDVGPMIVADRVNAKTGDLVNFAIIGRNLSSRVASHIGLEASESAGFQLLNPDLNDYGYFFDTARTRDFESGWRPLTEWTEIRGREQIFSWFSTYTVGAGQLTAGIRSSRLDQVDEQPGNDFALAEINSAPAAARVSVRQSLHSRDISVGDLVLFVTEIRNEGPHRVTGLTLLETNSANLEVNVNPEVNGVSGAMVTSIFDSLVRLPALEPGETFIWQRTCVARSAGNAWRRVRVAGFDQTPLAPFPESEAALVVGAAQADLELAFVEAPMVAREGIPVRVSVRVRNRGPHVATGVKVAVNVPAEAVSLGAFEYGPRASYDFSTFNGFQTNLRAGESASASFLLTPVRTGAVAGTVQVVQFDQDDPNLENNALAVRLDVGAAPLTPPILRVRKVRTDFFDRTPIAEVEIDQAALHRLAPYTVFSLDRSSNLRDWEYVRLVGLLPLAPVTFTDHAAPGMTSRAWRLRWP